MLFEIMKYIRNYFLTNVYEDGKFKIEDGMVSLDFISEGQYFLIDGSNFNDGAYKYPATDLTDETFTGRIVVLNPPVRFLELVKDIEDYEAENTRNNVLSESFGGYSYTRASNGNGGIADWQDIFKQRLNVWRKL